MTKQGVCYVLLLVLGFVLAGCGGASIPAPTATTAPTPTSVAPPIPTATPTPLTTRSPAAVATVIPTPTQPGLPPALTPSPELATLQVRVTDAPPEGVSKILITANSVKVKRGTGDEEAGWVTVIGEPRTFDLVAVSGVEQILGDAKLDPGQYNQVRMEVEKVVVTLDNEDVTARVPSDVLRIVGRFTVVAGETTILTLDFDAGKSVVVTGRRSVQVKPVVKLLVRKEGEPLNAAKEAPTPEGPGLAATPTPDTVIAATPTATPTTAPVPTATPFPTPTPTATTPPAPIADLVINISPSKDNTLYKDTSGSLSNGAGAHLFVGNTNMGQSRRAVIAFDVAGKIPAGSTIKSVTLRINMSRSQLPGVQAITLRRLLADWGEGTSDALGEEGQGIASTAGDATWVHRVFNTSNWQTAGGDFSPTATATASVGGVGAYTWGSTAQMTADVQEWLTNPASNFGWILVGNEGASVTSKRFDSRQNEAAANRPVLTVTYALPAGTRSSQPGGSISGY